MKGLIALDIDGTVTTTAHDLDPEVIDYFQSLHRQGWKFLFVTGRTFHWGYTVLQGLPFPFTFAVQNGAFLIEMPSRKILVKELLKADRLPLMEEICRGEPSDYTLFSGYANQDKCYWRPERFAPDLRGYLERRIEYTKEPWIAVDHFDVEEFAAIKCFGKIESGTRIAHKIELHLGLHAPLIRDPFDPEMYVIQATHPDAHKGTPVALCKKLFDLTGPVIGAGDDLNDIPLLKTADIAVAMRTAPEQLFQYADIIAPPAAEKGIISGIREAIQIFEVSS